MKKIFTLWVSLFFSLAVTAQTFTYTGPTLIPDDGSEFCVPITATGIPITIDTANFGLVNICINLTHTWDADLVIKLKAPDGTMIILSDQNGGADDDYTNTCFSMDAVTYITDGVPPYTGNFIPEQSLNLANNGLNPNDTWYLCFTDVFALADQGNLLSWSITFGNNPPSDPPPPPAPCGLSNATACLCPDGSSDCDLLPDMTASALIIQNQHTEYTGYLTMSNATPNIGWGPMEVHGISSCFCDTTPVSCSVTTCPDGNPPTQLVNQRIYHKNGSTMTYFDRPAGTMSYHPSHGHTHIDHWADFSLRIATSNPDATTWPIVGTGTKVSFCLINLGDCTSNLGYCIDSTGSVITMADIPNSPFGIVSGCGVDQGIYTGNLDIYSEGLPGMRIDFPGICNGNYHIVSITDPNNNFLEQNENNNWASVPVTLTDQISPSGTANFSYVANGLTVSFTNSSTISTQVYWDFGDGTSDTTSNPVHTYAVAGNYQVKLIILNQCSSPSTQLVGITGTNSIDDLLQAARVFPNPVVDEINVRFFTKGNAFVEVGLFDVLGKEVKTLGLIEKGTGSHEQKFSLNNFGLKKGSYFVRLRTSSGSQTFKIIKTKD